ncbi:hypothetical protein [Cronobacter dublinensis]|uniref:hypothetical protein n=1 Tax=Cronobacter dublinensis TaxID=413497 RepID=UPI001F1C1698|nr:hypothetical protein [Cronobacter dublinensis]
MDTTEELNGTYFYAGRSNLTASGLLFIIFCEQFAEQLGVDDFGAIVAVVSGRRDIKTRTKPADALDGTSRASKAARRVFGTRKFPLGIKLPTLIGGRLENGNYPTLRLYFVQQWRRMRDQQFINRDSFLLKRLNGSFYINRIPECYRRRM